MLESFLTPRRGRLPKPSGKELTAHAAHHELRQHKQELALLDRALYIGDPSRDFIGRYPARVDRISRETCADHRERSPDRVSARKDLRLNVDETGALEQPVELTADLRLADRDRL